MKTSLVIMAAGIGSRFGQGIKQLEKVGPGGEIIMDYSIHDALEAGFDRIVFIIRKDLEKDFREVIGSRIEEVADVAYVFQEINDLPGGRVAPEGRKKPWGTGQAILACRGVVKEPFAVINADDYYGKEAFVKIHSYLMEHGTHEEGPFPMCMAGFILKNTLSENGTVTRGICQVNEEDELIGVAETRNIRKTQSGAVSEQADGSAVVLDPESHVSMNMWGFTSDFLSVLEEGFAHFLDHVQPGDLKAEYLLPEIVDRMIKKGDAKVAVLESTDHWFGMTYQEDTPLVKEAFRRLVAEGVYPCGINQ